MIISLTFFKSVCINSADNLLTHKPQNSKSRLAKLHNLTENNLLALIRDYRPWLWMHFITNGKLIFRVMLHENYGRTLRI